LIAEFNSSLIKSIRLWKFWVAYAFQDVKNKYTRSFIGPFWVTISMGVTVLAMGPLYGALFNQGGKDYTLYLATGIVFWSFISTCINESCDVYINNRSFIGQSNFPLLVYIHRLLFRNLILLAHNLLIPIILAGFLGRISSSIIYLPLVVGASALMLFPICVVVSLLSTRFRDLIPMIQNFIQLCMFLTPVFWMLGDGRHSSIYVKYNPFYYIIDSFRFCFGLPSSETHFLVIVSVGIFFLPFCVYFYVRACKKVVYWI
jgi:lipopolysaccharide transport system permease protein